MKSFITKRMMLLLEQAESDILEQLKAANPKFNPQEWIRKAIRLLAAVEAAEMTGEDVIKQIQKKASKHE